MTVAVIALLFEAIAFMLSQPPNCKFALHLCLTTALDSVYRQTKQRAILVSCTVAIDWLLARAQMSAFGGKADIALHCRNVR
jgi:hypothetical protein